MALAYKYEEFYSYDDYIHWEGNWELIDGIPYAMSPSPIIKHQFFGGSILSQLYNNIENCDKCLVVAEEDWKVNNNTILKPDIALICDEPNESYITKAPEIVVEIISPSTAKRDETIKFQIYEAEKVLYYILVYPDELKAKIFKLKKDKFIKVGDFFTETYKFKNTTCKAKINFERVFRRYMKKS